MVSGLFHHISQRYTIQGQLGEGGMGVVYRAHDRLTDTTVALKQVNVSPSFLTFNTTGADAALALAKEFRVLAGLRHPNIVSVLDYGFDTRRNPFYTMHLLENAQSLTDYARHQPEATKIRLIIDTLQALVYLHRYGILHRDLKPTNVLVLPDGTVQVVDFGLALHYDTSGTPEDASSAAGTLAYMAPERLRGASASVASDLYAVGCMLYEALVGSPPFFNVPPVDFIFAVMDGKIDLDLLRDNYATIAGRLLAKDPAARYPNARTVIAALYDLLDTPIPPESAQLRESFLQASSFVGRAAELNTLRDALQHAIDGTSSVWLLGGESGVGKSRLLDEMRTQALCDAALVVRGQAVADGGLPYQVWRDVVRRLALEVTLSDGEAAVLKSIVPDIGALLGRPIADPPPLGGRNEQDRLVNTIVDVLRRTPAPLVVLLEDLQWADDDIAPIRQALAVLDQLPKLLVIGTYRTDERPTLPTELAGATAITLTRLDTSAMGQLALKMLGPTADNPHLLALLQRETEGNPFFMVEVLRALAETAGSLSDVGHADLPATVFAGGVQALIQRRLDRIPADQQRLLKQAAIAGRVFDTKLLTALSDEAALTSFLRIAADHNIVEISDGAWRFSHDKLRETVLANLSDAERRDLSRALAQTIEAIYPHDTSYQETLMECWRTVGDTKRELQYLMQVTQKIAYTNFARAQTVVNRGRALLPADDPRTLELMKQAAQLHLDLAEYEQAIATAQATISRAAAANNTAVHFHALNTLGLAYRFQGEYDDAKSTFARALELANAANDEDGMATILYRLGSLAYDLGEFAEALEVLTQSLSIKRRMANPQDLEALLLTIGMVLLDTGAYETALTYISEAQAKAEQRAYQKLVANALHLLGHVSAGLKDYPTAQARFAESLRLANGLGLVSMQISNLNNLGTTAYSMGNYGDAVIWLQKSRDLAVQIGRKPYIAANDASLAMVMLEQRDAALIDHLRPALIVFSEFQATPNVIGLLSLVARLLVYAGEVEQAVQIACLIQAHPATNDEVRDDQLPKLVAALQNVLPPEALAAQLGAGADADLTAITQAVLALPLEELAAKAFGPPEKQS